MPYDWIPEQGWEDIIKLMTINSEVFGSLADDIEKNEKVWKEVSMSNYAHITLSLSLSLSLCSGLILMPQKGRHSLVDTHRACRSYSSYCC